MRISTWNLQGLDTHSLVKDLHSYNIDIACIQETHLRGTDSLELDNTYTLYYTGPENSSKHGIGIVIKKNCLAKFKRIDDRVCQIEVELDKLIENKDINKNKKLTVISAYAPTLTNSQKNPIVADNFYNSLQQTVNLIPNKNLLYIGIDANAQIGLGYINYPGSVGTFGKGYLNSNGERLGEFLVNNKLIATNTLFNHKFCHRTTWTHPNINPNFIDKRSGTPRRNPIRNQIDYIITRINHRPDITNSRSYAGTTHNSDHRLVINTVHADVLAAIP